PAGCEVYRRRACDMRVPPWTQLVAHHQGQLTRGPSCDAGHMSASDYSCPSLSQSPISFSITLPISVLASGLLVRIFIIPQDCGTGSFSRSRGANDLISWLCARLSHLPN